MFRVILPYEIYRTKYYSLKYAVIFAAEKYLQEDASDEKIRNAREIQPYTNPSSSDFFLCGFETLLTNPRVVEEFIAKDAYDSTIEQLLSPNFQHQLIEYAKFIEYEARQQDASGFAIDKLRVSFLIRTKLAEKNNLDCLFKLAEIYEKGLVDSSMEVIAYKDNKEAFKFYSKYVEQAEEIKAEASLVCRGYFQLGICYRDGKGVDQNDDFALKNFQQMIAIGSSTQKDQGYYHAASIFMFPKKRGKRPDNNKARDYLERIQHPTPDVFKLLADCYINNPEKRKECLEKAGIQLEEEEEKTETHNPPSAPLEKQKLSWQDASLHPDKRISLMKKAANNGDADAQFALHLHYEKNKELVLAAHWLNEAVSRRHRGAQYKKYKQSFLNWVRSFCHTPVEKEEKIEPEHVPQKPKKIKNPELPPKEEKQKEEKKEATTVTTESVAITMAVSKRIPISSALKRKKLETKLTPTEELISCLKEFLQSYSDEKIKQKVKGKLNNLCKNHKTLSSDARTQIEQLMSHENAHELLYFLFDIYSPLSLSLDDSCERIRILPILLPHFITKIKEFGKELEESVIDWIKSKFQERFTLEKMNLILGMCAEIYKKESTSNDWNLWDWDSFFNRFNIDIHEKEFYKKSILSFFKIVFLEKEQKEIEQPVKKENKEAPSRQIEKDEKVHEVKEDINGLSVLRDLRLAQSKAMPVQISSKSQPIDHIELRTAEKEILLKLQEEKEEAYLGGGTLRARLLNRPNDRKRDVDIITTASKETLLRIFAHLGIEKAKKREGLFVLTDPEGYKIEIYQSEHLEKSLSKHARCCDFTMNTLFCDAKGDVYDPLGRGGKSDLKKGVLKTIVPANELFEKNPICMLRAIRFAVKENLTLSEDISAAMIAKKGFLKNLTQSFVNSHLHKMLNDDQNALMFEKMLELGFIDVLFPDIAEALKKEKEWIKDMLKAALVEAKEKSKKADKDISISLNKIFMIFIVSATLQDPSQDPKKVTRVIKANPFFDENFKKGSNLGILQRGLIGKWRAAHFEPLKAPPAHFSVIQIGNKAGRASTIKLEPNGVRL